MQAPIWLWDPTAAQWVKALADPDGRLISLAYGTKVSDGTPVPLACDDDGKVEVAGVTIADPLPVSLASCPNPSNLDKSISSLLDANGKVKVAGSFAEAGVAAVVNCSAVNSGAYNTIQPAGGVTWKIINIFWEYDVVISWYDGTHEISLPAETGAGQWNNMQLYVTNSIYLRVKNSHASLAKNIGYSGVIVT